ncbi:hypothetical protein IFM89_023529 [Coptis chinensis]|uniref:C2H2-type domain-containing protein n=1 Tax=Coptis chinensis TaxID=261450 RepID=A0A835HP91_9MAGN|nr:hypothetical protein IFM89_023529 [Coptis chinensis]
MGWSIGTTLLYISFSLVLQSGQASLSILQRYPDVEETVAGRTLKQEQERVHEVHCSRERSRAAWKAVDEYLMPFVEQDKYQFPINCRLHADNDMFRDQEQHKVHMDVNEWQCGYCKKSFRAEKFLDQHFDNRHYNLLNAEGGQLWSGFWGQNGILNAKALQHGVQADQTLYNT